MKTARPQKKSNFITYYGTVSSEQSNTPQGELCRSNMALVVPPSTPPSPPEFTPHRKRMYNIRSISMEIDILSIEALPLSSVSLFLLLLLLFPWAG